jgi:hypothetical protein
VGGCCDDLGCRSLTQCTKTKVERLGEGLITTKRAFKPKLFAKHTYKAPTIVLDHRTVTRIKRSFGDCFLPGKAGTTNRRRACFILLRPQNSASSFIYAALTPKVNSYTRAGPHSCRKAGGADAMLITGYT